MESILSIFNSLNAAIDGGLVTQEAFTIAVAALGFRVMAGWAEGSVKPAELPLLSHKFRQLDEHWKARREPVPRVSAPPAKAGSDITPAKAGGDITPAMTRAGVAVLLEPAARSPEELVAAIYRAMAQAAPAQ